MKVSGKMDNSMDMEDFNCLMDELRKDYLFTTSALEINNILLHSHLKLNKKIE